MNEIEKLYENAGIEKCNNKIKEIFPNVCDKNCEDCENNWYPDFDAEKQIELIKWCIDNYRGEIFDTIETEWFEEQLSAHINNLWQSLTEEDKQQIKEILNDK